jgi:predicted RNA-binding protein YlqC (UPF0109 family)
VRALLELLIKSLVDEVEAVQVQEYADAHLYRYEVRVAPGDVGRLIGRQGRTIRAVRQLLKAAALKEGVQVRVDVL